MTATFYRGLEAYRKTEPVNSGAVVTVGTFDGIHRGHQEIFRRVRESAGEMGLDAVLITFHPHPRVVVTPDDVPMLLTSIEEKEQFVPHFFDGRVLVLDFDKKMMNTTAAEFVRDVLVNTVRARKVVVGYDHAFGKNREGSIEELKTLGKEHDFDVEVVGPVDWEGQPVSSSRIRRAMQEDRYPEALKLLGHDYAIYGTVERGIGLGRKIGYPTANVKYSPRKLLPPEGVYACWVQVDQREFDGMMFIGRNHFNPGADVTVEANLFDFDEDIYDQEIIVYPTVFIRENEMYPSTDELVAQIKRDKEAVINITRKGEKQWQ